MAGSSQSMVTSRSWRAFASASSTRWRSCATSSFGRPSGLATTPRIRTVSSIRRGATGAFVLRNRTIGRLALAGEERRLEVQELPRHAQQPWRLAERQPQAHAAALRDRSRSRLAVEVARRPDQQCVGELAAELLGGQTALGRDLADVARRRRPGIAQRAHRGLELLVGERELERALRRLAVRGPSRDRIAPTRTRRELDPEVVVLVGSHRVSRVPSRPSLPAP